MVTAVALAVLAAPAAASAQGFLSPLIGYNFGGDSGCPEITGCENKNLNLGVAFGTIGSIAGAEMEFGYARNFFGEIPDASSSVLTIMSNVMLAPKFGPVQPYGLIGLGLIRTDVEFTPGSLLSFDNNNFGWNIGGGVILWFGDNFGLRGDVRQFHTFGDVEILGFDITDTDLDFGRAAGALVFRF